MTLSIAALLEAAEAGLKESPMAVRDRENLKKAQHMGPQYCKKAVSKKNKGI
jgi:hypothetical protein